MDLLRLSDLHNMSSIIVWEGICDGPISEFVMELLVSEVSDTHVSQADVTKDT